MSIFRREPETPNSPAPPPPSRPPQRAAPAEPAQRVQTHIANGSKVVGEISGAAELVIDGRVEGKIDLDSRVVVGPQGQVDGEVKARSVQIGGRVRGNVRGVERVEVLKSGRLEGDMVVPQNGVHIAEGAFFTGNIDMTGGPKPDKRQEDKRQEDKRQEDKRQEVKRQEKVEGDAGKAPPRPSEAAKPPEKAEPPAAPHDPGRKQHRDGGRDRRRG